MNEQQFLQLIDQHQGIIHKVCRLYRDRREDREDLFQEIVFQLWKSVPAFEGKARFSSWMYRIALSTAIATFRKKKPAIIYTTDLPEQAATEPKPGEQSEKLFQALRKLNDDEKAVITLYLEDLSYKEISEITGITENNVGVKLSRIKKKLHQLLNN